MGSQEEIKKTMTEYELRRIYEMSDDSSLYQNLVSSLFPSIHGEQRYKCALFSEGLFLT